MIILTTFKEWEDSIRGREVALLTESNRMYDAFDERIQMCRDQSDFVAYIYIANYESHVGIDPQLATKLFKMNRDSIEQVLDTRQGADVDVIFIPDGTLPYHKETFPYVKFLLNETNVDYTKDSHAYVRAVYGMSCYLNYMWREPIKYIALCPFAMLYNFYIKRMFDVHGIKVEYPCGITDNLIIKKYK